MKITIRPLPKNLFQKMGIVIAVVLFFFGLWQMDLICWGPVWNATWIEPPNGYFNNVFEFGRIGEWKFTTTLGAAYDICQGLMVIGFIVAILSLWLWNDEPTIIIKEISKSEP
jgi:hypothetical protein